MTKNLIVFLLSLSATIAQNNADALTNDTIIKLVQAGVPAATIINTIAAANKVDFRFIGPDLQRLTDARVPDEVFKAMVAKDNGRPIAKTTIAPAAASKQPVQAASERRVERPTELAESQSQPAQVASKTESADHSSTNPRLFITDSNSWEISGGFAAAANSNGGAASGRVAGGARPQTVEVIKTFSERCPGATLTIDKSKADYVVLLDHEGGKDTPAKIIKSLCFVLAGIWFTRAQPEAWGTP